MVVLVSSKIRKTKEKMTGVAYTVVIVLLKSITRDMQERISERSQSNGSSQSANLVITHNFINASVSNAKQNYRTLRFALGRLLQQLSNRIVAVQEYPSLCSG